MQNRTVLCRRLGQREVTDWLSLPHDGPEVPGDKARLTWFLRLPKSICYISSIGERRIGGTIVYHNESLRDLALISVRLHPEFRRSLLFQLIKSSLPWFRSQSIETVTTLVNPEEGRQMLPFPLRSGIPSWANSSLRELGFKPESQLNHYIFSNLQMKTKPKTKDYEIITNRKHAEAFKPSSKGKRQLVHTHFVPMISLSPDVATFRAVSSDSETVALWQILRIEGRFILGPIEWNKDKVRIDGLVRSLLGYLSQREIGNLELAMIAPEQDAFVEEMKHILGIQPEANEYTILRKIL